MKSDAQPEELQTSPSRWLTPALLSFVAGYVDTVGFVALFSLFTAHVTGNFVLIGATLGGATGGSAGLVSKLLALPAFIAAVAVSTWALRRVQANDGNAARWALIAQAALIGLFMTVGVIAEPLSDGDAPIAALTGMVGVCAMSVQNAAARIVFSDLAPSTVMTGNVTQLVIDGVDVLRGGEVERMSSARKRITKMLPPVLAFTCGALLGGLGFHLFGFACLLLALAALVVAAVSQSVAPVNAKASG